MKSLTQKDLANQIGITPSFLANIEQGQKGISVDKLVDVCRCFDVGLSDLLPIETQRDTDLKEKMIEEIVNSLRILETTQVKFLKTMVCSFNGK
jgi:transcriptional regulator with XRE-family HTH domain